VQSLGGKVYKTLSDSWVDQLSWGIDWALAALPATHPLRIAATAELKQLEVTALGGPRPGSEGFVEVPRSQWTEKFNVAGLASSSDSAGGGGGGGGAGGTGTVQVDMRGAIVSLVDADGTEWAGQKHPLVRPARHATQHITHTCTPYGPDSVACAKLVYLVGHAERMRLLAADGGVCSARARVCVFVRVCRRCCAISL
jgi:hypothetical protein